MIRHVTYYGEQTIDRIIDLSNEVVERLFDNHFDDYDEEDWSYAAISRLRSIIDHRLSLDFVGCLDSRL